MHSDFSVTDAQFALKPPHALGQYNFLNKNVEAVYRWQVFRKKVNRGAGGTSQGHNMISELNFPSKSSTSIDHGATQQKGSDNFFFFFFKFLDISSD